MNVVSASLEMRRLTFLVLSLVVLIGMLSVISILMMAWRWVWVWVVTCRLSLARNIF